MKPIAVIQARLGSTRLPGKVLRPICGKPMLWHVVRRVEAAGLPVVVAVPDNDANSALRGWLYDNKIRYGSGPDADVLSRYYDVVTKLNDFYGHDYDTVVRVTADCPLVDPDVIKKVLSAHESYDGNAWITGAHIGSYVSHGIYGVKGYPDGLDVEVMKMTALRRAWALAVADDDREHVTPFLWKTARPNELAKVYNTDLPHDNTKLSVDTEDDLLRVQAIYDAHYGHPDEIFPAKRFLDPSL